MNSPESTDPETQKNGHRERLRKRFLGGDPASLGDEVLLELLLSYAILRSDVKPLAKALLEKFGSLDAALAADGESLSKISGIKESSVALLKLAQHLRSGRTALPETTPAALPPAAAPKTTKSTKAAKPVKSADLQPQHYTSQPDGPAPTTGDSAPPAPAAPDLPDDGPSPTIGEGYTDPEPPPTSERKLQVTNGYQFEPAQLARLLSFIGSKPQARKITGAELIEGSGLSTRQVENLVSMGSALGLITPRTQLMTPLGKLICKHDLFFNSTVTLEYFHFLGAGQARHLVWFEVFNHILVSEAPMSHPGWSAWLRAKFAGQFSGRSLVGHIAHEVRFIVDAYIIRNFKKLNLLEETPEKTYVRRRYPGLQPLTLAAMIYELGSRNGNRVIPFEDILQAPGSPGRIFGMDAASLRQAVESLHQREWLRFEVRHGLDQVRLVDGFEPLEFLAAAYEVRSPEARPVAVAFPTPLLL